MLIRLRNLIFSPILVALTLGGFSVYLITKGEIEAAMGGAGAAIAAGTMKRNEDSEEDYETQIDYQLRIQALQLEIKNIKNLEEEKQNNLFLQYQLEVKEKELEVKEKGVLLSLREQKLDHERELLLKEKEFSNPKILPSPKEDVSQDLKDNSS